jgi:NhaP-type Na+/H+ or K+/H+ antiporter
METAIFAYLGLFLFNDRVFDLKLTSAGLFACVSSRAIMVIVLSMLVNVCVWIDLEGLLGRLWRYCFPPTDSERTERLLDDDSDVTETKIYLDRKTQFILFSAGIRGAVSYALVQNIPVYDAVTEHGSHFKGELRSMTSATIVIMLFGFGALTYFTVQRDLNPDRERAEGPLTHRLLSRLASGAPGSRGEDDDSNLSLEIDGPSSRR